MEPKLEINPHFGVLVESIKHDFETHNYYDFTIVAGGCEFKCHRLVLSAFSGFFKTMFHSNMKETKENKATLKNVSANIFGNLLRWMYNGESILDNDNVFNFMAVADQLDIPQLLSEGKQFLGVLLDDKPHLLIRILKSCNSYHWHDLRKNTYEKILKNLTKIPRSEMSRLEIEDLELLVLDPNLDAEEDFVLRAILQWVDFRQSYQERFPKNDFNTTGELAEDIDEDQLSCEITSRAKFLERLLKSSRYHLISNSRLWQVLESNTLVQSDPKCVDLVKDIAMYKTQQHLHQYQCLTGAMHRKTSKVGNFVLTCSLGKVLQISVDQEGDHSKWVELKSGFVKSPANTTRVCFYNDTIYFYSHEKGIHTLRNCTSNIQKFEKVCNPIRRKIVAMVPNDNYLVAVAQDENKIFTIIKLALSDRYMINSNWECYKLPIIKEKNLEFEVSCIAHIGSELIIFWHINNEVSVDLTRVSLFQADINTAYVTLPTEFDRTSQPVAFYHHSDTYILQENGSLWKFELNFQAKEELTLTALPPLWHGNQHRLYGAMLVTGELWLFVPENVSLDNDVLNDETGGTKSNTVANMKNVFFRVRWFSSPNTATGYVHICANRKRNTHNNSESGESDTD